MPRRIPRQSGPPTVFARKRQDRYRQRQDSPALPRRIGLPTSIFCCCPFPLLYPSCHFPASPLPAVRESPLIFLVFLASENSTKIDIFPSGRKSKDTPGRNRRGIQFAKARLQPAGGLSLFAKWDSVIIGSLPVLGPVCRPGPPGCGLSRDCACVRHDMRSPGRAFAFYY